MLVVIGTDCLGRYKSYYHKITTPNAPVSYSDIEFESSRSTIGGNICCLIIVKHFLIILYSDGWGRRGRDRMEVGFTPT